MNVAAKICVTRPYRYRRRDRRSSAARVGMQVKFIVTFPVASLSSLVKKVPREAKRGEETSFTRRERESRVPTGNSGRFTIVFLIFRGKRVSPPGREMCAGRRIPGTIAEEQKGRKDLREQPPRGARIMKYSIAIIVTIVVKYRLEGRNLSLSFQPTSISLY